MLSFHCILSLAVSLLKSLIHDFFFFLNFESSLFTLDRHGSFDRHDWQIFSPILQAVFSFS